MKMRINGKNELSEKEYIELTNLKFIHGLIMDGRNYTE